MENNENKTLEERKEEFKEAANQTVPVMGLEEDKSEDKTRFSPNLSYFINSDCDDTCISTVASIEIPK